MKSSAKGGPRKKNDTDLSAQMSTDQQQDTQDDEPATKTQFAIDESAKFFHLTDGILQCKEKEEERRFIDRSQYLTERRADCTNIRSCPMYRQRRWRPATSVRQ